MNISQKSSVTHIPYDTLGRGAYGWLDARYHFSFARYVNRARMGFGALQVINDDRVSAGTGFDPHSHDNMEIITYVRSGAITHTDSMGNVGRTGAGDIQVMSAGTGITHSEYNKETQDTTLYQIWIHPNVRGAAPYWETRTFPKNISTGSLSLLASGMPEHGDLDVPKINQDAALYGGTLAAGTKLLHPVKHQAYVLTSSGEFKINGLHMRKGDGAEITNTPHLVIETETDAEIIVIDVPA